MLRLFLFSLFNIKWKIFCFKMLNFSWSSWLTFEHIVFEFLTGKIFLNNSFFLAKNSISRRWELTISTVWARCFYILFVKYFLHLNHLKFVSVIILTHFFLSINIKNHNNTHNNQGDKSPDGNRKTCRLNVVRCSENINLNRHKNQNNICNNCRKTTVDNSAE